MNTNGYGSNGHGTNGALAFYGNGDGYVGEGFLELNLRVSDPELHQRLSALMEGRERNRFAMDALKVGSIALGQAQDRIDAERVRKEGDRLIENLGHALARHQDQVEGKVAATLREYFDPASGSFEKRVQHLLAKDGELERILRSQFEANVYGMAELLSSHVGKESPLLKSLAPENSEGILARMARVTERAMMESRDKILREFSLDNGEGALSRLVLELRESHVRMGQSLQDRIDAVTGEFSLDREDSALSRLVGRVEAAHREIRAQFSLDVESSALARMRRELLESVAQQRQDNKIFQQEVLAKLADMTARKQESERGTRHGEVFESAVWAFARDRAMHSGDIPSHVGNTTGRIRSSKKGDILLELGPEHVASGQRIVIEAKENASVTMASALAEIAEARENRDATVGLFVFSRRSAPDGLEMLTRVGSDVVVVWDPADRDSDVVYDAGLSVARAICVEVRTRSDEVGADISAIEDAVRRIQSSVEDLGQVIKWTQTIQVNAGKILKASETMRSAVTDQIEILDSKVSGLRLA